MKKYIGYIENGFNLDHIPQGNAWYIVKILQLFNSDSQTGVGLNLPSKTIGRKDLIKVENRTLLEEEINKISIFCCNATLSIIKNFTILEKKTITIAPQIDNLIVCPNNNCVSSIHKSKFYTSFNREKQVIVKCHYCNQSFLLKNIKDYKI